MGKSFERTKSGEKIRFPKMILVKIHETKIRNVTAVCDANLIGKKFEENGLQLEITERFYKGVELPEEKLIAVLRNAEILNIVGDESVSLAINVGIIYKENIIKIAGIPHAQFTTIE